MNTPTSQTEERRVIKFRAWDIRREVMQPVKNMTFRDDWVGCNSDDTIGINYFDKHLPHEFVLMQYTGLHAHHDTEIYDQDYFVADGVKALIHYSVNHACWFWGSERFSNAIARKGEVIGNKWENPDLLGASNDQ